nr:hypothetical protein CFP56_67419 [Quercus suber]
MHGEEAIGGCTSHNRVPRVFLLAKVDHVQSKAEKSPPNIAKLPSMRGVLRCTACVALTNQAPEGELWMPFRKWKVEPPTAPMENTPPMSSSMRSGHGSLDVSGIPNHLVHPDLETSLNPFVFDCRENAGNIKMEIFLV